MGLAFLHGGPKRGPSDPCDGCLSVDKEGKMKYEFKPWEKFKDNGESIKIEVNEPPCKYCVYWQPEKRYQYTSGCRVVFDGIRLCLKEEINNDFSCYEAKEIKDGKTCKNCKHYLVHWSLEPCKTCKNQENWGM